MFLFIEFEINFFFIFVLIFIYFEKKEHTEKIQYTIVIDKEVLRLLKMPENLFNTVYIYIHIKKKNRKSINLNEY